MFDKSQLKTLMGPYGSTKAIALEDPGVLRKVQASRRDLGRRMSAFDKYLAKKRLPAGEYSVSRKIDGEFTVVIFDGKECFTLNPGGTLRHGLPVLDEAAKLFKAAGLKSAMVSAELYVDRDDDQRPRVHDVVRVARKPENVAALDSLHLAAFMVTEIDGEELNLNTEENKAKLDELLGDGQHIHPVECKTAKDSKGVLEVFEKWVVEEGGEGVVARSDSGGMYKIKPRHSVDLAVVGFAEGIDDRAGLLHDMLLAVVREAGTFHIIGRVGGGFKEEEREDLLKKLQGMVVDSEYVEVNSDRVAYQMVRPEWVAEISCLDMISRTTRGATVDKMVLNWDAEKECWEGVRRLPLTSIISPQFERIRDDKSPTVEDTGITQISEIVELPDANVTAKDLQLPSSEIMRRAVATKELKGAKMVRKLMMWKTNKEEASPDFPAYVLHLTDFSPNRKAPLDHELRVSNSEEQIEELWDTWEKKYMAVRGWAPHEG